MSARWHGESMAASVVFPDVFGKGRLELSLLGWCRVGLILRLPFVHGHPIENLARFVFAHLDSARVRGLLIPTAQAIAAKSGEVHHIDILHIGALFHQVLTQSA